MDDLTGTCDELAALIPALGAALTRDNAAPGARAVLSAGSVVNVDVLYTMVTLSQEIPAAYATACDLISEPWQPRPPATCLRAIPRLHGRLAALSMAAAAKRLEASTRRWMRMTKLALGLRTPDMPIGWDCPLHAEPSPLVALGAEGFLREDMTVLWQHAAEICCTFCGATWPAAQWPHLGRMLVYA